MSKEMRKYIDKFKQILNEGVELPISEMTENKPSESEFKQALHDVVNGQLITRVAEEQLEAEGLTYNEDDEAAMARYQQIRDEIYQKVVNGDDEVLDKMWDNAWSAVLKNAINIITSYTKK